MIPKCDDTSFPLSSSSQPTMLLLRRLPQEEEEEKKEEEEKEEEEKEEEEKEERKKNTKTINYTIYDLQSRLGHLHDLLTQPQKIHLRGFELLKLKSIAHTVQQRVDTLFFEANIPCNWKINVRWNTTTHSKTDVHITLLNYIVKERVKELLSDYFNSCNYDKTVYID